MDVSCCRAAHGRPRVPWLYAVCVLCAFCAQWLLDNVMCNMDSGDVEPGCVAVVVPRRAIAEGLSKFVSNMRGCMVM